MKRSTLCMWLVAACVATPACSGSPAPQVLTGNVTTTGAVAVRAIADGHVITAGRVRSDGTFTLALPSGARYRLEILSASGVARVVDGAAADITFRVCAPSAPFDLGILGGKPDPADCEPGGTCTPPPECDPATGDNCPPPKCDPATDASCPEPPICDPSTDTCPPPGCDAAGNCKPPTCDPGSSDCPPPCDPTVDASCETPPPPCTDPDDPSTCKDACMDDPATCGCGGGGPATGEDPDPGSGDSAGCWPPPCDGTSCGPKPDDSLCGHPPVDFGCKDLSGT